MQALVEAFKEHLPQDDLDEDAKDAHRLEVEKETYAQYSSFLDKPHDLAVGYMLSERVLDNCSVKNFYNTKLSSTPEKLVDIFEAYSNHLRYSECEDQSAVDNLKNIEEADLSMMSHDEAVSAIGEVMDAESAAHGEL